MQSILWPPAAIPLGTPVTLWHQLELQRRLQAQLAILVALAAHRMGRERVLVCRAVVVVDRLSQVIVLLLARRYA